MDIKKQLKSNQKNQIDIKKTNSIEKKLSKNKNIKEHLMLQKEYTDEDIAISNKFLYSITNFEIMFTNMVKPEPKVNHINEHIIHNLKNILDNPLSLTKRAEQIEVDTVNYKRLKTILKKYDDEEIEEENVEGFNLFKVPGVKTNVQIGKRKENMNAFRIYLKIIEVDNKNVYKLLFVDPYHLAIPSGYDGKPAKIIKEQKFNQFKYCSDHLHVLLTSV